MTYAEVFLITSQLNETQVGGGRGQFGGPWPLGAPDPLPMGLNHI